jgi:hypothetical protein
LFDGATDTIASSVAEGWIALSYPRVCTFAREVSRSRAFERFTDESWRLVAKYLLAHEVGHLIRRTLSESDSVLGQFRHHELVADAAAGWLGASDGDDPRLGAFIATQLGCTIPGCDHPTPEERSHAYLTGHVASSRWLSHPRMNLLVIRTMDIDTSRAFYELLGLSLRQERHAGGPLHLSCELDGTLLELYPTKTKHPGMRFGLHLSRLLPRLERLREGRLLSEPPSEIVREGASSAWLIKDPDGNTLELTPVESVAA